MKEKKCKYCAMMIASEARIRPHCRKKQGSSFCFKVIFLLLSLYILTKLFTPSYDSYRDRAKEAATQMKQQNMKPMSQNTNIKATAKKNMASSNVVSQLEKRQLLAEVYNKKLTDKGLAHSVFSTGDAHTTLLINKIKMNEELINGIMSDQTFLTELRKIGFNNIEFCEPSLQGGSNCQTYEIKK